MWEVYEAADNADDDPPKLQCVLMGRTNSRLAADQPPRKKAHPRDFGDVSS